jgi:hypothetical protein
VSIEGQQKKAERAFLAGKLDYAINGEIKHRIVVKPPVVDVRAIVGSAVEFLKSSALIEVMRGQKFSFSGEIERSSADE